MRYRVNTFIHLFYSWFPPIRVRTNKTKLHLPALKFVREVFQCLGIILGICLKHSWHKLPIMNIMRISTTHGFALEQQQQNKSHSEKDNRYPYQQIKFWKAFHVCPVETRSSPGRKGFSITQQNRHSLAIKPLRSIISCISSASSISSPQ